MIHRAMFVLFASSPLVALPSTALAGNDMLVPGLVSGVAQGVADYHIQKMGTREVLAENGIGSTDSPEAKQDEAIVIVALVAMTAALIAAQ